MISPVQLVATTLNLFHRTVPDQVGWILAVGELYNGLNPISLDDSRITLLERPLVNGSAIFFSDFTKFRSTTLPNRRK